jgi:hypothetical protein
LIEEGYVVRGFGTVPILVGILSPILAAALSTAWITASATTPGISAATTSRVSATAARIASPSATTATSAARLHSLVYLFRVYADVPRAVRGVGIDRDNTVFVGKLIEVGEPCHVTGILISAVQ